MSKQDFIEDNTSLMKIVDGKLQINKDYEKECNYYARLWEEKRLTKELNDKEDELL